MTRYRPTWAPHVNYLVTCMDCGLMVGDQNQHDRWHTAIADVWDWINRVSGDSCGVARGVFANRKDDRSC